MSIDMTGQNQTIKKKNLIILHGTDSFIVHVKSEDVYEDLAGMLKQDSTPQTKKSRNLYL